MLQLKRSQSKKLFTDKEVLEALRRLKAHDYKSQKYSDNLIYEINRSYFGISDLIYFDNRNLSPEKILAEAKLKFRPKAK